MESEDTSLTASAYIRELIRTGGNIDTSYPEDRARAIRIIAGIANNINQVVKLGNSQGRLYYSDIDKLQSSMDEVKKTFGEVMEVWRLQRS
ncbi:plasmid mobilization relaxosome protein MobC [Eubacterium ventriosum]|uniref:plasmid mobilization relaxosome protein MobC n=1 Tax=Eubacterium ventriosum TaxID=39496 RepID=UPI002109E77B|nr:plasmid mobilization relaxosome protein MobC [Eubacterium ventriosum]MCQ5338217.1 MobC family plasmid mobilization relaxosome protein [Eubacterium ventriosum]